MTARFLIRDAVPFRLVVEPQEADEYAAEFGEERLLVLPFSNLGLGSIPARNWVWEHATAAGAERHWILDDNIGQVRRFFRGKRIPCASGPAFAAVEDFTERYENVAISGMNYQMFGIPGTPPFFTNTHVYSCLLILNSLPYRWRGRYNEDTDLCLQVLAGGWCTVLVNAFLIDKKTTMTMTGGNSDELYRGDGRLTMARSLERRWPGVVTVSRRYGRPQHVVDWSKFSTPLKLRDGVDPAALTANEYGMNLAAVRPVSSPRLRRAVGRDRYLLVGEAPARGSDGVAAFSGDGRSAGRLADLTGLADLAEAFEAVNLLDRWPGSAGKGSRFPLADARAAAAKLDPGGRPGVILAGQRVASAFGLRDLEPCRWYDDALPGSRVALLPHPSGVSRWWNDPANERRAKRFLRRAVRELRDVSPSGS